jgi:hypothetical protein
MVHQRIGAHRSYRQWQGTNDSARGGNRRVVAALLSIRIHFFASHGSARMATRYIPSLDGSQLLATDRPNGELR